jgi:hypothetical protein
VGPGAAIARHWQSLEGLGCVGSAIIAVSSRNPITLHHTHVTYEPGGAL